jgi:hypothetical protein
MNKGAIQRLCSAIVPSLDAQELFFQRTTNYQIGVDVS